MSSDKFHCTNGHCLTDCVLSSIDYDKNFPPAFCPHSGGVVRWQKCETTEKKPTVFDHITASPEVLAEKLVYDIEWEWYSTIICNKGFSSQREAIAATVARLKEMAE